MPIRMSTGSNTTPPANKRTNRNREILAANPNLGDVNPQLKQTLQQGADNEAGRITPGVIAVVVAILALAVGAVFMWLFKK